MRARKRECDTHVDISSVTCSGCGIRFFVEKKDKGEILCCPFCLLAGTAVPVDGRDGGEEGR